MLATGAPGHRNETYQSVPRRIRGKRCRQKSLDLATKIEQDTDTQQSSRPFQRHWSHSRQPYPTGMASPTELTDQFGD